ncbi:unnamed protein product [Adineta steineri]|uniref:Cadherin domain-containing protein n=1 Tax=Adineta steineri TaxID=433720 RepID=A0A819DRH8_9BILA|nr:unnamed protein product [Adineta steineri]CAF3830481.1 unnamed protein product [Adineta steineri]
MFYCCYCQQQRQQQQQQYEEEEEEKRFVIRTIEKLPVHSEVINLRRLLLSNNISDSKSADFTLAKRDEFPYMFFLINHSSRGILTIRKEIDRDELCRLRRCRCDTWCDLELEIFVNNEQFNIEVITIRILDQNDHSPQFSSLNNPLNLTIVENAQIGAMIKLEPAIDYDQGQNGIIGYSLISPTSLPFSLRYDLIRGDLSLVVEQNLDRELISSYTFDIIAYDGGNQTGRLHVYLTIDDVNDSPPKFDQSTYIIQNISENILMNSIIIRVHATDKDEGVNSEITYHLITQENCFQIDHITGDIRVICLLDYELQTKYRLEIEARDGGEGSKTDTCTLIIHIMDENDNYPIIDYYPNDIQNNSNSLQLSLSELLPINSLILSLSIIDQDSDENGRVTWKLDRSSLIPFELIRLTDTTGELRTKRLLDREYISEYYFKLEAHDHGKPKSKSTYLNIHITILDENDNAPIFRQDDIQVTISEHVKLNNQNGYEIYHVQADDYDQGQNAEVTYSILNQNNNLFQIDTQTGVIRAMVEFDRKQKDTYVLQIQATDKGVPPLSSKATITFTIISRNEYPPICNIDKNSASLSVMENSKQGTIVATIICHDDDTDGTNGQMNVYAQWWLEDRLLNRTTYNIPFEIVTTKSNTSESTIQMVITVNGLIDRELVSSYQLLLTITDNGNPPQSTNISFSIEILDENDHCPQLHIETSFIMINRDITHKNFPFHLIASDNDQGLNGQITFELSSLTSPPFIHLYSNGTLFIETNSKLIQEDSLIILHVQISDHGQPTPCLIVETLRLFIGTNRTDWLNVLKNNHNNDQTSLRLVTEQFQQGKRMAYGSSMQSTPKSSNSSKYSLLLSSLSTRKQFFAIIIGTSIFLSIVIILLILYTIDRLHKKINKKKSLIKTNGLSTCPYNLANGKRIASSSPLKTRFCYEDDSPTHNYTSLKSMKPIIVAGSSSQSSSSVDSTTRMNTAHNRSLNVTFSYTAIGTSDELTPVDFDDDDINNDGVHSGIELMMTTV